MEKCRGLTECVRIEEQDDKLTLSEAKCYNVKQRRVFLVKCSKILLIFPIEAILPIT